MTTETVSGLLRSAEPQSVLPATSRPALDAAVETLRSRRGLWASLPLLEKIDLLRRLRRSMVEVAEEWVEAAMRAEGLDETAPRSGEEWIVGPYFVLRNLRLLQVSLRSLSQGKPPAIPGPVRVLPNGQLAVQVFPFDGWDRLFYPGLVAEVWMQRGVTAANLASTQAVALRQEREGKVALVLSAGNVSSIGPMDALYKLFVENQVVVFKAHRANDYLGPLLERGFRPLVEAGFLRIVYGGVAEGAYLVDHPGVDEIHVTGSDKTYEAIVFGGGAEGAQRRERGEPRLAKRVTAELGNVSPVVVVPGEWSDADLQYHAENVATMLTNNAGFNCNAVRVLVTHRGWRQRQAFLAALRTVLASIPTRHAWYPGASERCDTFLAAHPRAERLGEPLPGQLPWIFVTGLDAAAEEEICFTTEAFCGVFCDVALAAPDAAAFLGEATRFCNEQLWGTLNATLIAHRSSEEDAAVGPALERAIAELRYGTVSLNHWAAVGYGVVVTPWGAFPGHPPTDIQSGVGVVHNTLMFERVEKTVFRAPFRAWPKPPWFATHRMGFELGRKLTAFEAAPAAWRLPGIFALGLRG